MCVRDTPHSCVDNLITFVKLNNNETIIKPGVTFRHPRTLRVLQGAAVHSSVLQCVAANHVSHTLLPTHTPLSISPSPCLPVVLSSDIHSLQSPPASTPCLVVFRFLRFFRSLLHYVSHPVSCFFSFSLYLAICPVFFLARTLARARARALTFSFSLSLTLSLALSVSLSLSLSLSLFFFSRSLSHCLALLLSQSLALSPFRSLAFSRSRSRSRSLSFSRPLYHSCEHQNRTLSCSHEHVTFFTRNQYGVATISRLLKIIGLFCKRAQ